MSNSPRQRAWGLKSQTDLARNRTALGAREALLHAIQRRHTTATETKFPGHCMRSIHPFDAAIRPRRQVAVGMVAADPPGETFAERSMTRTASASRFHFDRHSMLVRCQTDWAFVTGLPRPRDRRNEH